MGATQAALGASDYDVMWSQLDDFIRYNPGARHRRRISLSLVKNVPFQSFLDVGCGPGDFLATVRRVAPQTTKMVGADFSPAVVEKNRRAVPGVRFELLDIQKGSLAEQFDLVSCLEVIEHLDDRARAFTHLTSMVAPGGHLLISCPTGRVYETERRFGHTSHPTLRELKEHARANGLEVVRSVNWGLPLYSLLKFATNINTDWAIKNFGSGAYQLPQKLISSALYYVNFLNVPSPLGCQLFVLMRKSP